MSEQYTMFDEQEIEKHIANLIVRTGIDGVSLADRSLHARSVALITHLLTQQRTVEDKHDGA